jgi:hypothetical protein
MTDNDIRAGVVTRTHGSPRRRPVVDSRMPDGPLRGPDVSAGPLDDGDTGFDRPID